MDTPRCAALLPGAVVTRARSRLAQERVCVVEVDTLLTPAIGGSNPDNRPGLHSTLHLESWNSTQCRVSSGVTASTHLLLVCPVSMLVSHSSAGMGPGVGSDPLRQLLGPSPC